MKCYGFKTKINKVRMTVYSLKCLFYTHSLINIIGYFGVFFLIGIMLSELSLTLLYYQSYKLLQQNIVNSTFGNDM